jgi:hypothetical protein
LREQAQKSVIFRFGREDAAEIIGRYILALQGTGTVAILGDDELQTQVFTSENGGKTLLDRGETVTL